ncbi:MAG: TetR family transcriptional regulator [Bacteroidetes bacterium]|nr:TetR family transcriptional regulator [Bacteroidota bacterium]
MKLTSTEDRILNGARELFFKQGIRTITMDDIAEHLAISKKRFTHIIKTRI